MPGLYADENFPFPVVEELRRLGFDVLTMYEDGKANQSLPDPEVLATATQGLRILITLNRKDFIQLHRHQPDHTGIIVCSFDPNFIGQAQRIAETLEIGSFLINQLVRINRGG